MINEFLLTARKKFGFSQDELAQKMGISRQTLASIENASRDISLSELKQLSEIFDLPISIMLDEELKMDEKLNKVDSTKSSFSKFHDLVLACIKYGADDDGKITKTKLAKLVYLADFASYYKYLNPISGFEYRRLAQGPVSIQFFDLIDSDESICVESKGRAMMLSLLESPKESNLSKKEQELVKDICKKWKTASTKEIVDFTHAQLPWATCKDGEVIPYELINMEDPINVY